MDEKLWQSLYERILEGDIIKILEFLFEYITKEDIFANGWLKKICISLLLLAVLAGIFGAFLGSFQSKEVSKMSFFMIHIFLFSMLISLYSEMIKITKDVINAVLVLMEGAIPIYYMAVAYSGNSLSAFTYYRVGILAIYVVEQIILHLILPMVSCYMFIAFGKALYLETKLSVVSDFMKKAVSVLLKIITVAISGISFLQSMVSPMVDGVKSTTAGKVVSMIPGIGNITEGMAELTVGSMILVKNSVGLCVFLMLLITAAIPVIQLFVVAALLKGCGALMAVIADKEFANPVTDTSEAVGMLLKIVLTVLLLFMVSMAIVLFTTNE